MRIGLTRTLLLASLLASSLLTLALAITVAPLGAQSPGDRVEIIMGALPPQNSKEYKALLKIAGNPTGQVLSLTKCEMWHVRRDKLEALQKAAAARNVSVKVLDGSWNEMFATMGGPAAADPKLAAMMDLAKKSKSTSSVGMMSARNASMIEYALTKDMDKTSPAERPMMIKIQLKDNMTVTAIRREVVIVGEATRDAWARLEHMGPGWGLEPGELSTGSIEARVEP